MERNLATMAAFAREHARSPAAARQDAQERDDRAAADGGRRGRRLRPEDERGRGAGRCRHRRHLHPQRGDRPRQAGARRRSRRHACGSRSRSTRSRASSASPPRSRAAGSDDRRLRRGRRRPGPLRRAGRRRRPARAARRRARAARGRPALRRPAGVPRRGPAPARRRASARRRRSTRRRWRARRRPSIGAAGIACPLVTGAGTGTFAFDVASGVWGELQAGSYLFMDRDYADNDAGAGRAALRARAVRQEPGDEPRRRRTPSSTPATSRTRSTPACLASGSASSPTPTAATSTASCARTPTRRAPACRALGETVWLVPGHCDPTVNLHDRYVVVRGGLAGGVVDAVWPIEARGCVS